MVLKNNLLEICGSIEQLRYPNNPVNPVYNY